jgi:hypothetical protein
MLRNSDVGAAALTLDLSLFRTVCANHVIWGFQHVAGFRRRHVTGWRINSEVLTIQWRQLDFRVGEVRLHPGTTKNREGRVFYLTPELQQLLKDAAPTRRDQPRSGGRIVDGADLTAPSLVASASGSIPIRLTCLDRFRPWLIGSASSSIVNFEANPPSLLVDAFRPR